MAKLKTGIGIAGLSGTSGGAVFALRRDGSVVLRERPSPSRRTTPAQAEARRLMALASAAWRGLTADEQRAWLLWARRTDPGAGPPGAANAFRSLAVRWLAVNGPEAPSSSGGGAEDEEGVGGGAPCAPGLAAGPRSTGAQAMAGPDEGPPRWPPAAPFGGDAVVFEAGAVPGGLRWTADRANAPGVVTELLAAPVQSALAEPRDRDHRTVGRKVFTEAGQAVTVPLRPGRYAVAVRFVLRATGQTGPALRLGVVQVG
jgi:hypothetical protein